MVVLVLFRVEWEANDLTLNKMAGVSMASRIQKSTCDALEERDCCFARERCTYAVSRPEKSGRFSHLDFEKMMEDRSTTRVICGEHKKIYRECLLHLQHPLRFRPSSESTIIQQKQSVLAYRVINESLPNPAYDRRCDCKHNCSEAELAITITE